MLLHLLECSLQKGWIYFVRSGMIAFDQREKYFAPTLLGFCHKKVLSSPKKYLQLSEVELGQYWSKDNFSMIDEAEVSYGDGVDGSPRLHFCKLLQSGKLYSHRCQKPHKHPKNWETALWGKERLYWKRGFIERKALLKKGVLK